MSSRPINTSRFKKNHTTAVSLPPSEVGTVDYDDINFVINHHDDCKSKKRATDEPNDRPKKLSKSALMEESIKTASAVPISESSKGFQLLAKFGYTQGGLGKDGRGITEPLQLIARKVVDKTGVGVAEMRQRAADEIVRDQQRKAEERIKLMERFQQDVSDNMKLQRMTRAVTRAERVIMELDIRSELSSHKLWPVEHQEKLLDLTETNDAHEVSGVPVPFVEEKETPPGIPLLLTERLEYLREKYCYCLYCGCQYESMEEIDSLCPGPFEDDH
jgi:hypothetical protein